MLCEQPEPFGAFYVWLENELLTQGHLDAQGLLQSAPPDSIFYATVLALAPAHNVAPQEDAMAELRDLLNRMLIDRIKEMETRTIESAGQDPQALSRYRDLQTRRRQLEQAVTQAVQATH